MTQAPVRVDGVKVSKLRGELGWSQQRLSHEAGLHVMTVSKIERGAGDVVVGTVVQLARAFARGLGRGIGVDDLLTEPEPAPAAEAVGQ